MTRPYRRTIALAAFSMLATLSGCTEKKQIHQIDKRIKAFVDQGETATTKLVETLDRELRSQITALRKEVEHLSGQFASMRPGAVAPKSIARSTATPVAKRASKASTRPPAKAAVRKAPAKSVAA